ncbi:Uncharacterised protein [Mycobacteroides abscessus]|nr:Uncharacterised protein [Mycobacteroides abscessus]
MIASEVRRTPLAPWTSRATSGTVDAAPGWNSALAVPATARRA